MAAFNALGTWGAIFLLHQFRGLQVSFGLQGSREPRLYDVDTSDIISLFQSTRLSRASTATRGVVLGAIKISIHKALASLDLSALTGQIHDHGFQSTRLPRASTAGARPSHRTWQDFNPQGSREPRRKCNSTFSYTGNFNPQGSREPRRAGFRCPPWRGVISIHKALASLDEIFSCISC